MNKSELQNWDCVRENSLIQMFGFTNRVDKAREFEC